MQGSPRHYFRFHDAIFFVNHHTVYSKKLLKKAFSTLRITGGFLKGRSIILLEKSDVRYTSAKGRAAIFNILGNVEGKKVLDLFAGSGSFTIEALSRGASSATSVEIDREMAKILERNLTSLDLKNSCHVLAMDIVYAVPFLAKKAISYDIIFMDPPYEKGHVGEAMKLLTTNKIYHDDTFIVIEHSKREIPVFSDLEGWRQVNSKGYGDTLITLFQAG